MTKSLPLSRRRRFSVVLAVGFLALAVGVFAARTSPADGWELSIYRATPIAFWAGIGVAVVTAAAVALAAPPGSVPRRLAVLLGPLAVVSVVALPILRGYYFFGAGDALSYLGWARLIEDGHLNPVEFLYPGIQSTAIAISAVTGLPLRRTLMTVPTLFVGVFVLGVALVAGRVSSSPRGVVAGAFAAMLILPVNNVHTYIIPYPTSVAIFFTPLVLYFLFRYVSDDGVVARLGTRNLLTPFGVLLGLAGIATILYHPQIGANVVSILGVVVGLQLLARATRRWVGDTAIGGHRLALVPTAVVAAFFLLWAPRFERAQGTMGTLVTNLLAGGASAGEIETRSTSLAVLGSGIEELFLKLFAVSLLLSAVAGVVMLATVLRRLDRQPDRNALLTYLSVGFVPVFVLFLAFFAASISVQQFRYLGFIMGIVTIVVAVAFADGLPVSLSRLGPSSRTAMAVAVFVLLLAPQLSMVFASPHIYQPNSQVTERTMQGYDTAFEHRDPDVWYTGIRGGPRRYVDAHHGTSGTADTPTGPRFEGKEEAIPFGVWGSNMSEFYSRCRYVAIEDSDYQREVTLYDGFRYDAAGFEEMDTSDDVHRVQSNGDFRLYVLEPPESACTT